MKNILFVIVALLISIPVMAADDEPLPNNCGDAIAQAEKVIDRMGACSGSAGVAEEAASICENEMIPDFKPLYRQLYNRCTKSYKGMDGTMYLALSAICHMNAARYIMSLNQGD